MVLTVTVSSYVNLFFRSYFISFLGHFWHIVPCKPKFSITIFQMKLYIFFSYYKYPTGANVSDDFTDSLCHHRHRWLLMACICICFILTHIYICVLSIPYLGLSDGAVASMLACQPGGCVFRFPAKEVNNCHKLPSLSSLKWVPGNALVSKGGQCDNDHVIHAVSVSLYNTWLGHQVPVRLYNTWLARVPVSLYNMWQAPHVHHASFIECQSVYITRG